jgi:two-component sensor histidine kinase/tetratricopeptide (TPR) repeat protein
MLKKTLPPLVIFLTCFLSFKGQSQPLVTASSISFHPASQYKLSWQRLLLQLSSTYYNVVRDNQVDLDSSLLYTSRSLGLSRLPVIAEGITDQELLARSKWIDQRDPAAGIRLLAQTTGKLHLGLLVLLGAYYCFQSDSYHHYADSVKYFLNSVLKEGEATQESAQETSFRRQALCLLGKLYAQGADSANAEQVFTKLIAECISSGDAETEGKALFYRGLYTAFSPATTQNRLGYLNKALDLYQKLNNPEGEINCLTDMGYLHVVSFDLKNAFDDFSRALQLEESIGYPHTQYTTDVISMVCSFRGEFGEPLKYSLETIKTAEANRDSIGWPYFYSRLGDLYRTEGARDEEALKWMQKALDRFLLAAGDPGLYPNLYDMVGAMCTLQRCSQALALVQTVAKKMPPENLTERLFYNLSLEGCYQGLQQYNLCEEYLSKADSLEKKLEVFIGPFRSAVITFQYAYLYLNEGKYAKAKLYANRYLSDPSNIQGALQNEISEYENLIFLDSVLHDPTAGVRHYKRYTQLIDSNFRVSGTRQAEELQVKYATEEKENQITLLNQKAKLEQADLKQANLLKDVTIGGIILVLIIAGLLYRQNTLKQKTNELVSRKNGQLQHLLTEKEWLLKEIHHRVKNNFQTVMGLLGTQSDYLRNEVAIAAIADSQRRIHTMSLIHQRLYQTENLSAINMPDYIHELVDFLSDSFNTDNRIRFKLKTEPIELDLSQCIPLGLILNETITNAFKYAFPNGREGVISISLEAVSSNHLLLTIEDNGIGLPAGFSQTKQNSMGINLIKGLSAELGAEFILAGQNGTKISISFPHQPEGADGDLRVEPEPMHVV